LRRSAGGGYKRKQPDVVLDEEKFICGPPGTRMPRKHGEYEVHELGAKVNRRGKGQELVGAESTGEGYKRDTRYLKRKSQCLADTRYLKREKVNVWLIQRRYPPGTRMTRKHGEYEVIEGVAYEECTWTWSRVMLAPGAPISKAQRSCQPCTRITWKARGVRVHEE